jgi:hypothetical protein
MTMKKMKVTLLPDVPGDDIPRFPHDWRAKHIFLGIGNNGNRKKIRRQIHFGCGGYRPYLPRVSTFLSWPSGVIAGVGSGAGAAGVVTVTVAEAIVWLPEASVAE